jgi:hypothetical protein
VFRVRRRRGYGPSRLKKPKGQALRVADRCLKHLISRARVVVENVLAGVKRCRIVTDVLRLTTEGSSDLVMEMACGLHNLRTSCRHLQARYGGSLKRDDNLARYGHMLKGLAVRG